MRYVIRIVNLLIYAALLSYLSGCALAPNGPATSASIPQFHAWNYMNSIGDEPFGYATYSYVLAGRGETDVRQEERYRALVAAIKESTPNTSDVAGSILRDRMNIFLIPGIKRRTTWNVGLSLALSSVLTASDKHFTNPGPFIVTLYEPIGFSATPKAKMLFVDLTNTHPEAMREVVFAYKQRISEAPIQGVERLHSLKLTLLNFALVAEDRIGFAEVAYADLRAALFPR